MSLAHQAETAPAFALAVTVPAARAGATVLAPLGIRSAESAILGLSVEGGTIAEVVSEPDLRLGAAVIRADGGALRLTYRGDFAAGDGLPEDAFAPHESAYTVAADALATHARALAQEAGGGRRGLDALVAHAASMFVYGHPERRFNDGADAVPLVACGGVPGSCVDINTYLVALLRAAGYEAAYVAGYFFPAEKAGTTTDMHCWVVSRHAGECLSWDIAHHKKMGREDVAPGLNPRPGVRVALTHSMGHTYPAAGVERAQKLLCEPVWLSGGTLSRIADLDIRLG